jgi:preprotein translocase subunit SecA
LLVLRMPPHQRSHRRVLPSQTYKTQASKIDGIVQATRQSLITNRPVLIGTRTIERSEQLSDAMTQQGIFHVVLNARQSTQEATIISNAGQPRAVTIATNMAGRGTDIAITPEVRAAGGLHVIVFEPHLTLRIDRQLHGRCGRQGDPGTVQSFLSPEDHVFELTAHHDRWAKALRLQSDAWLPWRARRAQGMIARWQREQRYQMAMYESQTADDLRALGLHPHLDVLTAAE